MIWHFELSVAPSPVSSAILDADINAAAYTDKDTADYVNPFAPAPSWRCDNPFPVGPI